eukprot:g1078.t1
MGNKTSSAANYSIDRSLSAAVDRQNYGVSLRFLLEFLSEIESLGVGATALEVCEHIKRITASERTSFLSILQRTSGGNSEVVGVCTHVVSHAWNSPWADTVEALKNFSMKKKEPALKEAERRKRPSTSSSNSKSFEMISVQSKRYNDDDSSPFFWIDIFCVNQHNQRSDNWCDGGMRNLIDSVGQVVFVLNWRRPISLTRSWCIWECALSLSNGDFCFDKVKRDEYNGGGGLRLKGKIMSYSVGLGSSVSDNTEDDTLYKDVEKEVDFFPSGKKKYRLSIALSSKEEKKLHEVLSIGGALRQLSHYIQSSGLAKGKCTLRSDSIEIIEAARHGGGIDIFDNLFHCGLKTWLALHAAFTLPLFSIKTNIENEKKITESYPIEVEGKYSPLLANKIDPFTRQGWAHRMEVATLVADIAMGTIPASDIGGIDFNWKKILSKLLVVGGGLDLVQEKKILCENLRSYESRIVEVLLRQSLQVVESAAERGNWERNENSKKSKNEKYHPLAPFSSFQSFQTFHKMEVEGKDKLVKSLSQISKIILLDLLSSLTALSKFLQHAAGEADTIQRGGGRQFIRESSMFLLRAVTVALACGRKRRAADLLVSSAHMLWDDAIHAPISPRRGLICEAGFARGKGNKIGNTGLSMAIDVDHSKNPTVSSFKRFSAIPLKAPPSHLFERKKLRENLDKEKDSILELAKTFLYEALDIRTEEFGEKHSQCTEIISDLSQIAAALGNVSDSIDMMRIVLENEEERLGKRHPDTIGTAQQLADMYCDVGDMDSAQEYFKWAMLHPINSVLSNEERNHKNQDIEKRWEYVQLPGERIENFDTDFLKESKSSNLEKSIVTSSDGNTSDYMDEDENEDDDNRLRLLRSLNQAKSEVLANSPTSFTTEVKKKNRRKKESKFAEWKAAEHIHNTMKRTESINSEYSV